MDAFVDRGADIAALKERYDTDEPSLITVWGRRRVGKTELVEHSIRGRDDVVYYQATETTKQVQLDDFVAEAARTFSGIERIRREWEDVLGYLFEQDALIVLDEFPFLIESDEGLPSVIQRLWDHEVEDRSATLVLVGSSISMMKESVMSGGSPLHGRFDMRLQLEELPFDAATEFVPDYDLEETVLAWGVFGGTPHYLQAVDDDRPLRDNIRDAVLSKRGFLHDEPEYVLRTELENPNRYFSILKTIAAGNATPNEIAQAAGIDSDQISHYLKNLQDLEIVDREVPVTENPAQSRRGQYVLTDALFRFWFRFVYGQGEKYDRAGTDAYEELIEPYLADAVSPKFEELCRAAVYNLYDGYTFNRVGRWWYQEQEIDVVGLTTGETMVAGECKFTSQPMGYDVLANLEHDVADIRWTPQGGGDVASEFCLFSLNGFNQSLIEAAEERDDLRLFSIEDIVTAF
ncbi:ATP-binding protein [Halorhabdus rudnickae]|uniref:ATP-binding protein n=1 Tax=Halorhabdus rudnickae TaxID=1775544 RepID=UPI001083155A|nr:ATP-binding protein [Halorhabdus rudnickae]